MPQTTPPEVIEIDWGSEPDYAVLVEWRDGKLVRVERMALREQTCKRCMRPSVHRIDFWVPDDVWAAVDREQFKVLCLECFDRTARERYEAGLIDHSIVQSYIDHLTVYGVGLWALQPWADLRIRRIKGIDQQLQQHVQQLITGIDLDIASWHSAGRDASELQRVRHGLIRIQAIIGDERHSPEPA